MVINECGGTDVLKIETAWSVPSPTAGHVLVKQVSTSVNPVDIAVRGGHFMPSQFPAVRRRSPGPPFFRGEGGGMTSVLLCARALWSHRTTNYCYMFK